MVWDLGLLGVLVLLAISLGFGVFTQLVFWSHPSKWIWLAAAAAYAVVGLFISEVMFGWATEADLQPNIDGLSFDEVLLGLVVAAPVVFVVRYLTSRRRSHGPMSA